MAVPNDGELIEQLRDHLEQSQNKEQVERTRHMKRNVIIRIDSTERRQRSPPRESSKPCYPVSIIKMTQCCAPIPTLIGETMSSETTPSTRCNSMLDPNDSDSLLHSGSSHDDYYRVTDVTTVLHDSVEDGIREQHRELLRLKADILSDDSSIEFDDGATTDGAEFDDGATTDRAEFDDGATTDGADFDDGATTDGATTDGAEFDDAYTDANGLTDEDTIQDHSEDEDDEEEWVGDDEMEDDEMEDEPLIEETLTREIVEETAIDEARSNQHQRIFIVRSEHSIGASLADDDEEDDDEDDDEMEDDEMEDEPLIEETLTREIVEETAIDEVRSNQHQRIFIVRSEHSIGASLADADDDDDDEEDDDEDKMDDDEMEDKSRIEETLTREIVEETAINNVRSNQHQRIFIIRSEHSIGASIADGDEDDEEAAKEDDEEEEASTLVNPAFFRSSSSTLMVTFSDEDGPLEQLEEVKRNSESLDQDEDGRKETSTVHTEAAMVDESLQQVATEKITEETASAESEVGKMKALEGIGKALEEAILNVSLNLKSSSNEQSSKLSASEPILLSSGSLSSQNSILSDDGLSVSIETLYKIPYIHGAFVAAAPFIMHDLKWKRILRKLMPDAHAKAVVQMQKTSSDEALRIAQIMKWAENNPVVAAYGILSNSYVNIPVPEPELSVISTPIASNKVHSTQDFTKGPLPTTPATKQDIPPLEWNVFLDPLIVSQLDTAIDKARKAHDNEMIFDGDNEVNQHLSRLVKRMILAHGSTSQLLSEALGAHRSYTFASIVQEVESAHSSDEKMLKSGATGIFLTKWLATFAGALRLGGQLKARPTGNATTEADDDVASLIADSSDEMLQNLQPVCGLFLCLGLHDQNSTRTDASKSSFGDSAKYIAKLLGGPLRIVLNLRSRRVPAQVWARLVDYMRHNDVLVESVASFDVDEIRSIGTLVAAPVKQFRFFHSAGDLQKACHAGEIREGDSVFFNAASLIETDQDPMNAFVCGLDRYNDEIVFSEYAYPKTMVPTHRRKHKASIEDYKKRYRLNIGCFFQEFSVSPHTIDCLVDFFNRHSSLYNLGLAYGGINGKVVSGGLSGDGFAKQRFMGRQWDTEAKPQYAMQPIAPWHHQLVPKTVLAGSLGPLGTVNDGGRVSKTRFNKC